jgi:hypothetical protein
MELEQWKAWHELEATQTFLAWVQSAKNDDMAHWSYGGFSKPEESIRAQGKQDVYNSILAKDYQDG